MDRWLPGLSAQRQRRRGLFEPGHRLRATRAGLQPALRSRRFEGIAPTCPGQAKLDPGPRLAATEGTGAPDRRSHHSASETRVYALMAASLSGTRAILPTTIGPQGVRM